MTFQEAVKIVEDFTAEFIGANLSFLDGLLWIENDLAFCAEHEDAWRFITDKEETAYRVIRSELDKAIPQG